MAKPGAFNSSDDISIMIQYQPEGMQGVFQSGEYRLAMLFDTNPASKNSRAVFRINNRVFVVEDHVSFQRLQR